MSENTSAIYIACFRVVVGDIIAEDENLLKRSTKKHRLVYRIFETEVYVDVLSAYGHYNDK